MMVDWMHQEDKHPLQVIRVKDHEEAVLEKVTDAIERMHLAHARRDAAAGKTPKANLPGSNTTAYLNKGRAVAKLNSDQKFYPMSRQDNMPGRKKGGESHRSKAYGQGWEWGSKNFSIHNNRKLSLPWMRNNRSANRYGIQ